MKVSIETFYFTVARFEIGRVAVFDEDDNLVVSSRDAKEILDELDKIKGTKKPPRLEVPGNLKESVEELVLAGFDGDVDFDNGLRIHVFTSGNGEYRASVQFGVQSTTATVSKDDKGVAWITDTVKSISEVTDAEESEFDKDVEKAKEAVLHLMSKKEVVA